jgi:hypothetical protein
VDDELRLDDDGSSVFAVEALLLEVEAVVLLEAGFC